MRDQGDFGFRDAVRENGCLSYERNDEFGTPHYATRLTANGMIPWASVNPQNGLSLIYNATWSQEALEGPEIVDLDYPNVLVSHARFDKDEDCLHVGLRRGQNPPNEATFGIAKPKSADGRVRTVTNGKELPESHSAILPDGNSIKVTVPFEVDTDLTITI